MRSIIQAAVILLSNVAAFSLLGLVWEVVRGEQYNYNVNSTVLFNYVMSDTIAFQNTVKASSYAVLALSIWQIMSSLGSPIPVPQAEPRTFTGQHGKRGKRAVAVGDPRLEDKWNSSLGKQGKAENEKGRDGPSQHHHSQDFYRDVVVPACNQLFQPNGIARVTIISSVMAAAQTIFWILCAIFFK